MLEAGDGPAAAVAEWGHVRLFSPWRYDVDQVAARLLRDAGWVEPDPDVLPTGGDLVADYLRPLADLPTVCNSNPVIAVDNTVTGSGGCCGS